MRRECSTLTRCAVRTTIYLILLVISNNCIANNTSLRHVLLLHSYHQGLSWSDDITKAVKENLSDKNIQLNIEYLDSKRNSLNKISESMSSYLIQKYADKSIDVVIAVDNNALTFLNNNQERLFYNSSIVFCGINNLNHKILDEFCGRITGITENFDPLGCAKLAKELFPDTKRLVVILGNTTTASEIELVCKEKLALFEEKMEKLWLTNISDAELENELKKLSKNDAVILAIFNRGENSSLHSYKESGKFVSSLSKAPVFGLCNFHIGTGILGGRMPIPSEQGRLASVLTERILAGEKPYNIPIIEKSPISTIFDSNILKQFNIPETMIPKGATIINQQTPSTTHSATFFWAAILLLATIISIYIIVSTIVQVKFSGRLKPKLSSLISTTTIALPITVLALTAILWATQDYLRFSKESLHTKEHLLNSTKDLIRNHVDIAVSDIQFHRKAEYQLMKDSLQSRVEDAHYIATFIYENNADKTREEISKLIHDELSKIRWNNGAGYFFVCNLEGVTKVHPLITAQEGKDTGNLSDPDSVKFIQQFINIANTNGDGFTTYKWFKTDKSKHKIRKTSFVKLFEPLGWVIGTGEYHDDIEDNAKRIVIEKLRSISFANGEGYIFVKSYSGIELVNNSQPDLVGKNLWETKDHNGNKLVQKIIDVAKEVDGGFVPYVWNKPSLGKPSKKLSFVRGIQDWEWAIGAGLYLDDIEKTAASVQAKMRKDFISRMELMIVAIVTIAIFCAWMSGKFSKSITSQFNEFEHAFGASIREGGPVNEEVYSIAEFQNLAAGINNIQAAKNRAQQAMHKSEQRLELAMNAGDHGFWDWNIDTGETYFSPRYYSMLGYEPGELPMKFETWVELIHPDDRKNIVGEVKAKIAENKPYRVEFRIKSKDDGWKWISGRGKPFEMDSKGNAHRVVCVHTDITERKKMETTISENIHRMQEILATVQTGVIAVNFENDEILESNPAACNIIGISKKGIVGKKSQLYFQSEKIYDISKKEKSYELNNRESNLLRPDGKKIAILETFAPITIYSKECLLISFVDISQQKQQEMQLRKILQQTKELNQELAEQTEKANYLASQAQMANEAKSEFLANMSHEIRTPMNAIIGFSEILAEDSLTDEQRSQVQTILSSSQHLLQLINDILDFSKIEAGHLDIDKIECPLADILNNAESMMTPKATEKNIELRVCETTVLPAMLLTDPSRLTQCIINLLGNAIKFTHSGFVELRSSLTAIENKPYISFEIIDTGIGIPLERQSAIFDSFTQADGSTTRKYGGTGLGLSITKQLVGLLGGEVKLISKPNEGSTFSITIPVGMEIKDKPCLDRYNLKDHIEIDNNFSTKEICLKGNVLVAEDTLTNQILLKSLLEKAGITITFANDGKEALEEIDRQNYDLVIMDMQMPNIDGYEATAIMRRRGIKIPIIALTANAMVGDSEKCIKIGCDGYLSKPINRNLLFAKLSEYLPQQKNIKV